MPDQSGTLAFGAGATLAAGALAEHITHHAADPGALVPPTRGRGFSLVINK